MMMVGIELFIREGVLTKHRADSRTTGAEPCLSHR
jgi:hypothetical protein